MNKIEKMLITTAVIGMVGFSYAIATLRGVSDVFDWEDDDE